MTPDRLPDINLLPKIERRSNSLFYLFIIILSVTLIGYGLIGYYYFATSKKVEQASEQLAEIEEEIETIENQITSATEGESNLETAVQFAEYYEVPTSVIIEEVVDYMPNRGYLTSFSYRDQQAELTTELETLDSVANYTLKLTQSDYIREARVNNVETFIVDGDTEEEADFTVIPRYRTTFQLDLHKQNMKGAKVDE